MAQVSGIAMALASANRSDDVKNHTGDGMVKFDGAAAYHPPAALLTPPITNSPEMPACDEHGNILPPSPLDIQSESDGTQDMDTSEDGSIPEGTGMPLSKGALSGLDASASITPAMLAKHHLPGIMLGNGPRPIRYVMGELTQTVPGFSRIPPAKARRLVVAALESRSGGGLDGNVSFHKTGWGKWDAHIKGSSRDSGIGSFNEGHMSPTRSDRSSYALSHGDSGIHMPRSKVPAVLGEHSRGSWASSIREEDERDMEDMDMLENEADKMSLDGSSASSDTSTNDDTDDDDWAAVGPAALRKASLPAPGAARVNYNALSIPGGRIPSQSWLRRSSAQRQSSTKPISFVSSFPYGSSTGPDHGCDLDASGATPEEKAAVVALLSLGSV